MKLRSTQSIALLPALRLAPQASWRELSVDLGLPETSAGLSAAERLVLAQLVRGFTNEQIAAALGKSPATVKNQVSAILRKAGLPNRKHLIIHCLSETPPVDNFASPHA